MWHPHVHVHMSIHVMYMYMYMLCVSGARIRMRPSGRRGSYEAAPGAGGSELAWPWGVRWVVLVVQYTDSTTYQDIGGRAVSTAVQGRADGFIRLRLFGSQKKRIRDPFVVCRSQP